MNLQKLMLTATLGLLIASAPVFASQAEVKVLTRTGGEVLLTLEKVLANNITSASKLVGVEVGGVALTRAQANAIWPMVIRASKTCGPENLKRLDLKELARIADDNRLHASATIAALREAIAENTVGGGATNTVASIIEDKAQDFQNLWASEVANTNKWDAERILDSYEANLDSFRNAVTNPANYENQEWMGKALKLATTEAPANCSLEDASYCRAQALAVTELWVSAGYHQYGQVAVDFLQDVVFAGTAYLEGAERVLPELTDYRKAIQAGNGHEPKPDASGGSPIAKGSDTGKLKKLDSCFATGA